jgi:hypothetical protein
LSQVLADQYAPQHQNFKAPYNHQSGNVWTLFLYTKMRNTTSGGGGGTERLFLLRRTSSGRKKLVFEAGIQLLFQDFRQFSGFAGCRRLWHPCAAAASAIQAPLPSDILR